MTRKVYESPVSIISVAPGSPPLSIEFPGPMIFLESAPTPTTPGVPQDLIDNVGPASGSWRLRRVEVVCRGYTAFELQVGGAVVKRGYTSQAESTISLPVEPWVGVAVGQGVKLVLAAAGGPAVDVSSRVYYTEHIDS
jgi:hypothetical protein